MPRKAAQKRRVSKPKPEPAQLKALEKSFDAKDYRAVVKRARPLVAQFPDQGGLWQLLIEALDASEGAGAAGVAAYAWTEARPNSLRAHECLLYYAFKLQLSMLLNQVGAKARDLGGGTPGLPLPDEKLASLRKQPDGSVASIEDMVQFDLGRLHLAARDYQGTLRMLEGVDLSSAHNNRGIALFHLERSDEAQDVFLTNWRANPDNLFALAWAARVQLYRGDESSASELCQRLVAPTPTRLDDALLQLELLLLMQRDQDAWDAFERILATGWYASETELGGAVLRHYAACAASRIGDAPAARRLWNQALALVPDHQLTLSNLSSLDSAGQPSLYPRILTMDQVLPTTISGRFHGERKEADTDALLDSLEVATDYLRRLYLCGDDILRRVAGLLLRFRAPRGDAAAVSCLIDFARLPIGTLEDRSAFLHALREHQLIDRDQPMELWDGKQMTKVKLFGANVVRGGVDTGLPPPLEELLSEATEDQFDGLFDAAEQKLTAILEQVPNHPTATGNLAALCMQQGRNQQGRELLERTVATHPDYLPARGNLARLLILAGDLERAHAVLGDPYAISEIHIEDAFNLFSTLAMLHAAQGNDKAADSVLGLLKPMTGPDEQPLFEQAEHLVAMGRNLAALKRIAASPR